MIGDRIHLGRLCAAYAARVDGDIDPYRVRSDIEIRPVGVDL